MSLEQWIFCFETIEVKHNSEPEAENCSAFKLRETSNNNVATYYFTNWLGNNDNYEGRKTQINGAKTTLRRYFKRQF